MAVVQPGVINIHLQKEVAKYGLFYPPDPASMEYSSLGGNVSENAGGMRAAKIWHYKRLCDGFKGCFA